MYVWDACDGTLLQGMQGHQGVVTSVAWNSDGTRLASGSSRRESGELFMWEAHRGARLRALEGHPGMVSAVTWGRRVGLLVSGGGDGVRRWWDLHSGECVRMREAHRGAVQALKVSPDGSTLASCGDDGAITLWSLESGEHVRTLRRDRPYERLKITGIQGLTEAEIATLCALGAVEDAAVHSPWHTAGPVATAGPPKRRERATEATVIYQDRGPRTNNFDKQQTGLLCLNG